MFSLGSLTAPLAKTAPPKDRRRAHRRRGASDFEKLVATGARMGLIRGNHPIIKIYINTILYYYIIYICPKHSETLFMYIYNNAVLSKKHIVHKMPDLLNCWKIKSKRNWSPVLRIFQSLLASFLPRLTPEWSCIPSPGQWSFWTARLWVKDKVRIFVQQCWVGHVGISWIQYKNATQLLAMVAGLRLHLLIG